MFGCHFLGSRHASSSFVRRRDRRLGDRAATDPRAVDRASPAGARAWFERTARSSAVLRQRDRGGRLPLAAHQAYREVALLHGARLPDARFIEAHEIRRSADRSAQQRFALAQCAPGGDRPVRRKRPSCPPRRTLRRWRTGRPATHGRTWITWFGSPLPQYSVPCTSNVSRSPTMRRLRQNSAEMPR